ncbi:MAG: hypothetical protein P1U40_11405 [Coxiellaceae bacterium]|nr:hypothetical protein [Coxiellaceae bacterium]
MRLGETQPSLTNDLERRLTAVNMAVHSCAPKGSGHYTIGGGVTLDDVAGLAADVKQRRLALIRDAQSFLSVSTYKFEADSEEGVEVLAAIKDRLRTAAESDQPFTIKMLINQRGGPSRLLKPRDRHQQLIYDEVAQLKQQYADYPNISVDIKPHDALLRDTFHQKLWVADNANAETVALLGSGDIWHASNEAHRRREMCTILRGFLARELLSVFTMLWQAGLPAVKRNLNYIYAGTAEQFSTAPQPSPKASVASDAKTKPTTTRGMMISKKEFASMPDATAPALVALEQGIKQTRAGETISMIVSNINNQRVIDAIIQAVKRGVQFRFYADKYENHRQESRFGGGTNIASIDKIVSKLNPAHWPQLEIRWATRDDNLSKLAPRAEKNRYGGVHTKATSFSWGMTLSGSSAYDEQANCSRELDMLMYGKPAVNRVTDAVFTPFFNKGRDYFIDRAIALVPAYHKQLRHDLASITKNYHSESTDQQRCRAYQLCANYVAQHANDFETVDDFYILHARDLLQRSTKAHSTLPQNIAIDWNGIKINVSNAIQDYYLKHGSTGLSLFHSGGRHRAQQLLAALEKPNAYTEQQIARVLLSFLHYEEYKYNGITRKARLNPDSLNTYLLKAILQVDKLPCDANQCKSQVVAALVKVAYPVAAATVAPEVNPAGTVPVSPSASTVSNAMSTPVSSDDERRPSFI